jgi:hypothetical protein
MDLMDLPSKPLFSGDFVFCTVNYKENPRNFLGFFLAQDDKYYSFRVLLGAKGFSKIPVDVEGFNTRVLALLKTGVITADYSYLHEIPPNSITRFHNIKLLKTDVNYEVLGKIDSVKVDTWPLLAQAAYFRVAIERAMRGKPVGVNKVVYTQLQKMNMLLNSKIDKKVIESVTSFVYSNNVVRLPKLGLFRVKRRSRGAQQRMNRKKRAVKESFEKKKQVAAAKKKIAEL